LIDVALVMANHQGRKTANMAYRWTADSLETLSRDPKELFKLPYAPADLEYYALREIATDEELTIDYGEEWINAWSLYTGLQLELLLAGSLDKHSDLKFRHPIIPADGLFPASWNAYTCVGETCPREASTASSSDINGGEL
jgi:hypothetical protein